MALPNTTRDKEMSEYVEQLCKSGCYGFCLLPDHVAIAEDLRPLIASCRSVGSGPKCDALFEKLDPTKKLKSADQRCWLVGGRACFDPKAPRALHDVPTFMAAKLACKTGVSEACEVIKARSDAEIAAASKKCVDRAKQGCAAMTEAIFNSGQTERGIEAALSDCKSTNDISVCSRFAGKPSYGAVYNNFRQGLTSLCDTFHIEAACVVLVNQDFKTGSNSAEWLQRAQNLCSSAKSSAIVESLCNQIGDYHISKGRTEEAKKYLGLACRSYAKDCPYQSKIAMTSTPARHFLKGDCSTDGVKEYFDNTANLVMRVTCKSGLRQGLATFFESYSESQALRFKEVATSYVGGMIDGTMSRKAYVQGRELLVFPYRQGKLEGVANDHGSTMSFKDGVLDGQQRANEYGKIRVDTFAKGILVGAPRSPAPANCKSTLVADIEKARTEISLDCAWSDKSDIVASRGIITKRRLRSANTVTVQHFQEGAVIWEITCNNVGNKVTARNYGPWDVSKRERRDLPTYKQLEFSLVGGKLNGPASGYQNGSLSEQTTFLDNRMGPSKLYFQGTTCTLR